MLLSIIYVLLSLYLANHVGGIPSAPAVRSLNQLDAHAIVPNLTLSATTSNSTDLGPDFLTYFSSSSLSAHHVKSFAEASPLWTLTFTSNDNFYNFSTSRCASAWDTYVGIWTYDNGTTTQNATYRTIFADSKLTAHTSQIPTDDALIHSLARNNNLLVQELSDAYAQELCNTSSSAITPDSETVILNDELRRLLQIQRTEWVVMLVGTGALALLHLTFDLEAGAAIDPVFPGVRSAIRAAVLGVLPLTVVTLANYLTGFPVGVERRPGPRNLIFGAGTVAVARRMVYTGGIAAAAAESTGSSSGGSSPGGCITQEQIDQAVANISDLDDEDEAVESFDTATQQVLLQRSSGICDAV